MRRNYIGLIIALISFIPTFAQTNLTPSQILSKAVSAISQSKGVEASFTVTNSGFTGRGTIKTSGLRYHVSMPDVEVWFNGKDLYTYSKRTDETTIVTPTEDEIQESNPLAYVTGAQKNYNVSFSTVKKTGKYVLELLPKNKNNSIKRITLTLNKSNYTPEKIVVEPTNGNPISSEITSFKTGVNWPLSSFEYPKSKYPKVEVVDLR